MLYDAIFVSLYILGWLICAFIPWLTLSVATRGHAGLTYLPLCLFVGVVAGVAVPVFGLTNVLGLWLSFAAAFAVPTLLLAARRFSLGGAERVPVSATNPVSAESTVTTPTHEEPHTE
ncbi:MAG: hypothetical protein ACRDG3_01610 [Tepidiformaceae bacterium]